MRITLTLCNYRSLPLRLPAVSTVRLECFKLNMGQSTTLRDQFLDFLDVFQSTHIT